MEIGQKFEKLVLQQKTYRVLQINLGFRYNTNCVLSIHEVRQIVTGQYLTNALNECGEP